MNLTTKLLVADITKFQEQVMLVEGKKDASALQTLGFSHVFVLNEHQGSMRERVERIASSLMKKDKEVCLLFDNDKAGRKLIACVAPVLREFGICVNQMFRKELIRAGISHIEGLARFFRRRSMNNRVMSEQ